MQFIFGWIAGILTAGVAFIWWYIENREIRIGYPDIKDVQEDE